MIQQLYTWVKNDRLLDLLLLHRYGLITQDEEFELLQELQQPKAAEACFLFYLWQVDKLKLTSIEEHLALRQLFMYHS